jgi:hypothetical protein
MIRSRASNATSLSFPNSVPVGNDHIEILSWPQALIAFHLDPIPDKNDFFGHNINMESRRRLITSLQSKQRSVEEIISNGSSDTRASDSTTIVSLRLYQFEATCLTQGNVGEERRRRLRKGRVEARYF